MEGLAPADIGGMWAVRGTCPPLPLPTGRAAVTRRARSEAEPQASALTAARAPDNPRWSAGAGAAVPADLAASCLGRPRDEE